MKKLLITTAFASALLASSAYADNTAAKTDKDIKTVTASVATSQKEGKAGTNASAKTTTPAAVMAKTSTSTADAKDKKELKKEETKKN